jgi:hypothetical protein
MNITTKFSTLKLLYFSFSSCLTIEQSIVFKTMDRQCESFPRNFSSATRLHKSFMFIRNTRTASSINENSEIFQKFQKNSKFSWNFKISKISKNSENFNKILNFHKTCSHHVNLCWSLLFQKNQTLVNDWENSIKMSMRQYSDLWCKLLAKDAWFYWSLSFWGDHSTMNNVFRYNKILIDCVFGNSKFVVPSTLTIDLGFASVNSQRLGDNKLAIPSYLVNKYILISANPC